MDDHYIILYMFLYIFNNAKQVLKNTKGCLEHRKKLKRYWQGEKNENPKTLEEKFKTVKVLKY